MIILANNRYCKIDYCCQCISLVYPLYFSDVCWMWYLQHKCDLINMSYGEPTLLPDYGRFVDLVNEVTIPNLAKFPYLNCYIYF